MGILSFLVNTGTPRSKAPSQPQNKWVEMQEITSTGVTPHSANDHQTQVKSVSYSAECNDLDYNFAHAQRQLTQCAQSSASYLVDGKENLLPIIENIVEHAKSLLTFKPIFQQYFGETMLADVQKYSQLALSKPTRMNTEQLVRFTSDLNQAVCRIPAKVLENDPEAKHLRQSASACFGALYGSAMLIQSASMSAQISQEPIRTYRAPVSPRQQ